MVGNICNALVFEPRHEISINVVCATSKGSDQPVHMRSLIKTFASCLNMSIKILTEHFLEFLSLNGGCTGSFESTLVKAECSRSHHIFIWDLVGIIKGYTHVCYKEKQFVCLFYTNACFRTVLVIYKSNTISTQFSYVDPGL